MHDCTSKLLLKVVLIYEMEGIKGIERYASANGIPLNICVQLLNEYVLSPKAETSMAGIAAG